MLLKGVKRVGLAGVGTSLNFYLEQCLLLMSLLLLLYC